MVNKICVPYDLALQLKLAGFDIDCIYHYKVAGNNPNNHSTIPTFEMNEHFGRNHNSYPNRVSAPLYEQVSEWLRDKHNIHVVPYPKVMWPDYAVGVEYYVDIYFNNEIIEDDGVRDYFEALQFGIKMALNRIINII